ncbi:cell division protein FtsA [Acidobacteriota bacterium]
MARRYKPIVGLDVGTKKICIIIAEPNMEGELEVIGMGHCESKGMRKGVVVNLDQTVSAIRCAVEEAELMAGVPVDRVCVGIAGAHLKSFNSRGVIAVSGKDREITQEHIHRAIANAKAVSIIPPDREILHVIPTEFAVDEQDGIKNPEGMTASRLEVDVHIVTGSVTATQNIVSCANRAGIEVSEIILEQLASSESVLTEDEKELGVAIIDIGGGTSDIAIFEKGSLWYTEVLPLGGEHFTNDIAVGLRTPMPEAEKIKKKWGCALASLVEETEPVEVPIVGPRKPKIISRQLLCEIIQPRAEELFQIVHENICKAGYEKALNSGVVLTGGGSLLEGNIEIAEQIFDLPIRMGYPQGIGGLKDVVNSPIFSTCVGLVQYGYRSKTARLRGRSLSDSWVTRIGSGFRSWIAEHF